jgi:hypothetical protein
MDKTDKANLPVPSGWKPSTKLEALAWLQRAQLELSTAIDAMTDSPAQTEVYIAQQLIQLAADAVQRGQ